MNTKRFVNLTAFWTITSVLLITVLGTDKCNYMNVKQSPTEITVGTGANIQLFCAWICDCVAQRVTVEWSKDGEMLQAFQPTNGQFSNGTFVLNLTNIKANDSGVYICEVKVVIPQWKLCDGNGTILTVEDSVTKTNLIPQSVLIAAVCSGTLILFLVSLCVSLWKSFRRRRWDKHSSEGYRDKIRRPDRQIEEEEEKNNDVKDEKNKVNNTEDETCADDVGKLFQVSREDIVEARKKLKVKRACFFRGNGKPNTSRSGHFKKRRSSHLYINSQELKKQSQTQRTPNIGPTQAKHHCTPQKRSRRTRGKQLTAEEIYNNI